MTSEDRRRLYRRFVDKWGHPDYPPEPEEETTLAEAESELGLRLPHAYREFMLEWGPFISSGALLEAITERELPVRDLSEFHAARDVGRATLAWRQSKLPKDFVTIASDGSGNQFCLEPPGAEAEDAPVWLWLHETDTAEPVAPSFADWLSALLRVEPPGAD